MLSVVLAACAADGHEPDPTDTEMPEMDMDVDASRDAKMDGTTGELDVCGLAAALPDGDICQHACDPSAIRAQLLEEGADTGVCYQLYCQLTDTAHVLVGVCLVAP
jgi:hypothetical protein